jgi:chromate reductase, NAD(P)H dehydrogenase (quinone)
MHTTHTHPDKVLVVAASTRTGSINQALAGHIAKLLDAAGHAELIDLRQHVLPLYDGDLEARDGIPAAAVALAAEIASADALVIVSPEYNGTFSPLLKNTIDWVSRVDAAALAHLRILVASASPGRGGGANGAAMVCTWLRNMGLDVADRTLTVGEASIGSDGALVGLDDVALDSFVGQCVLERSTN